MAKRKRFKKVTAYLCLVATLLTSFARPIKAQATSAKAQDEYEEIVSSYSIDDSVVRYVEYLDQFANIRPTDEYIIEAEDYVYYSEKDENGNIVEVVPESYSDYEGVPGISIVSSEDSMLEYKVDIKNEGLYEISLLYYPIAGKNSEIQRSFFLDGKLPYDELAVVDFFRIWKNNITDSEVNDDGVKVKLWKKDNQGNDLKPTMIEVPEWVTSPLYDSNGYVTDRLSVYLTKGSHTITMLSVKEPMLLNKIILNNSEEVVDYVTKKASWDAQGARETSGQLIRIEAENVYRTSSQMLYPTQDQSSPAVYPSSTNTLKNNTIGGNSWRLVGQWLEWDFEVGESGYYNMAFYTKQNFSKGIYVSRKIQIDGQVLFDELSDYGFTYESSWRMDTLADNHENAYMIYLEAGKHTLRMQNVLGEFSTIISEVQDSLTKLNNIYRSVIRITGVAPDEYRDYQIEKNLPELKGQLIEVHDQLDRAIKRLRQVAGRGSDKEAVLITMRDQLKELIKDQEEFAVIIAGYKINTRAVGNWLTQAINQPLQLDTIYIYSPDVEVKVENSSFWAKLWYELQRLFYSFFIDYNQIGNVAKEGEETKTITLWVGTGRDQANVIKSLIDENFTSKTNINVNVQLVDMSTLLQATLAGQGPDVAIQVNTINTTNNLAIQASNDLPMNYGLRNAVADLSQFDDLEEVKKRFNESAMTPFQYDDKTFALPETQTFPMLFYRKDILKELGIEVPKTWDEVKVIMSILNQNQMEFGMLPHELIWLMILNQHGGTYYTQDATASALDSDEAIEAFKEYCRLYTDYKLDKATSAEERFRTGEAPLIIADYTLYNNLQVSAPDLKGLWGFAPVPGVVQKDGTINNKVASVGSGCIMMEASKDKESSWEFMKWWTSAETQTRYGKEMESLMGASARVATANMEAFANMPWPNADYEALSKQLEQVVGVRQVPGGYYTWRNVNNAFYEVTTETDSTSVRESITDNIIYINDEINYKRKEFGMPLATDK